MPVINIGGITDAIGGAMDELTAVKTKAEDAIETGKNVIRAGLETIPKVLPQMLPAAAAALATLNYRGSQGSFLDIDYPITLAAKFMQISPEDNEHLGRPLMQPKRLEQLAGFTLCKNPQIVINGSIEEEEAIQTILASGFYIE